MAVGWRLGLVPHWEKIPIPNEDRDKNKFPSEDWEGDEAKIYPVSVPTSSLKEIFLSPSSFPLPQLGKNPHPRPRMLIKT